MMFIGAIVLLLLLTNALCNPASPGAIEDPLTRFTICGVLVGLYGLTILGFLIKVAVQIIS